MKQFPANFIVTYKSRLSIIITYENQTYSEEDTAKGKAVKSFLTFHPETNNCDQLSYWVFCLQDQNLALQIMFCEGEALRVRSKVYGVDQIHFYRAL